MRLRWAFGLLVCPALLTGGCSISGGGGFLPVSTPATPVTPVEAAPPSVVYGAFLEGPVGSKLGQADRDKALAAEQDALASGQRKTWKGERGTYGYVEPGAVASSAAAPAGGTPAPAETCKSFTSTIYLGGRPQVGHGTGCQSADGTFRITG